MRIKTSHLALACLLATTAATASAQDSPLEREMENYWAVDRNLPVVQDRLYSRSGRFGVGLYSGLMPSEPYYWYIPVGGRLTLFFNNNAGIELSGQYTGSAGAAGPLSQPTEIHKFAASVRQAAFDPDTDLEDRFLWRANGVIVWNPLYGKWSFLNSKLSHFDLNLVLGGGATSVLRPDFRRTEATTVIAPELVWGGGLHFFLGKRVVLRADGRFYVYQGPDTPSRRANYDPQNQSAASDDPSFLRRIQMPGELLVGLTFLFGGGK